MSKRNNSWNLRYTYYQLPFTGHQIGCSQLSCFCGELLCVPGCGLFWRKFHDLLRINILFGVCVIYFVNIVRFIWFVLSFCFSISLFRFFSLGDLSIGKRGVLRSTTITVWDLICDFHCIDVSFMNIDEYRLFFSVSLLISLVWRLFCHILKG